MGPAASGCAEANSVSGCEGKNLQDEKALIIIVIGLIAPLGVDWWQWQWLARAWVVVVVTV